MRFLFLLLFCSQSQAQLGSGFFKNPDSVAPTFTDNFTRANADPMSITASDGHTWTSGPGSFENAIISGNQLSGDSYTWGCRVLTPSFTSNQRGTITIGTGGTGSLIGVCARIQSTTDASCYMARFEASTVAIYRIDDTGSLSLTQLGLSIVTAAPSAGDILSITTTGSTIEVFLNSVSLGTRTDSTYTGGQPGVFTYTGSTLEFVSLFTALNN